MRGKLSAKGIIRVHTGKNKDTKEYGQKKEEEQG